jgi:hypothetical protein
VSDLGLVGLGRFGDAIHPRAGDPVGSEFFGGGVQEPSSCRISITDHVNTQPS